MARALAARAQANDATFGPVDLDRLLDQHRVELTGYCYRMLGSAADAQDAVQETVVRAWRGWDRFDGVALRAWLYRIATNVCLTMLRGRGRRARPMDLTPASPGNTPLGATLPENRWIQPVPDGHVLSGGPADPAELAVSRETIRLAFVTALQHLPPRQRAVLILRDVLRWRATEVAELLDASVVSVKSALQRARATLTACDLTATDVAQPMDAAQEALLARYVDAFERYDIDALVDLLHHDAVVSMPPHTLWLRGVVDIRQWVLREAGPCRGSRLVPTVANGSPAFAIYRPTSHGYHEAFGVKVVEIAAGRIVGVHNFVDASLFPLFDLPPTLRN